MSSNSKWKSEKAKYKRAVYLHASLAVIAFGFLVLLAVIASSFRSNACFNREICGTKNWIIVHASSNLISFRVVSGAAGLATVTKSTIQGEQFKLSHERVGLAVYILFALQICAAFFRPIDKQSAIMKIPTVHSLMTRVSELKRLPRLGRLYGYVHINLLQQA